MTERRRSNVTASLHGRGRLARKGFSTVVALSTLAFALGCDVEPIDPEPVDPEPLDQPGAGLTPGADPVAEGAADPAEASRTPSEDPRSGSNAGGLAAQPDTSGAGRSSAEGPGNDGSDLAVLQSSESMRARAALEPTQGNEARGYVDFTRGAHGVLITAELTGLEPGTHGIHVHEFGDCSAPDGSSAGDHFTPEMNPHGAPRDEPEAHHAGDLGNITADDSGAARKEMGDVELTIDEGEFSVVGRAVVVHVGQDDLTTQPSGDAGDPVACGVVELVDSETSDRG